MIIVRRIYGELGDLFVNDLSMFCCRSLKILGLRTDSASLDFFCSCVTAFAELLFLVPLIFNRSFIDIVSVGINVRICGRVRRICFGNKTVRFLLDSIRMD
jgi:hypothetical protein